VHGDRDRLDDAREHADRDGQFLEQRARYVQLVDLRAFRDYRRDCELLGDLRRKATKERHWTNHHGCLRRR
jgi:hypothetical protein